MDRIHCSTVTTHAAAHRDPKGYSECASSWTRSDSRAPYAPTTSQALDVLCHGVIITDVEGRVVYINRRAEMIIGRTHKQVLGHSIVETLIGADYQLRSKGGSVRTEAMDDGQFSVQLETHGIDSRFVEVRVVPLCDESNVNSGELYEIHDVVEPALYTKHIIHQATHDPLTELANKPAFLDYLKRHFEVERVSPTILALLDLDGFRRINDECGYLAGDEVLRDFVHCLIANTRQADLVARLGSDEFVILLVGCDIIEARRIFEEIRAEVNAYRYSHLGRRYSLTVSIGLTNLNPDMTGPLAALKYADQACLRAKHAGGDRIVVERQFEDIKMVETRRRSIPQKLFNESHYRLYQQPIYSLSADDPTERVDVLLRLLDQDHIILPHEFMPDVRRYGLESELDQWMLGAIANIWSNRLLVSNPRPLQCFMNLSRSSIAEAKCTIDYIRELITDYELPKGVFCLNIQERHIIESEAQVAELIQALSAQGVMFALDGIGAGEDLYSLGYLRDLSVDYIRLSAQALAKSADDAVYGAYVQALSHITHVLEVPLIGVGTENQEDLQRFKELKVDHVQGHALSAPEPFSVGWIGADTGTRAYNLHSVA